MEASKSYFSVGEYWDSLSYTYGEMDHNQDAHRQRIVDWINDTHGTAGAFDVTTKGIFHSVSISKILFCEFRSMRFCYIFLLYYRQLKDVNTGD